MANNTSQLDLSQLAVDREQPTKVATKVSARFKRSWLTRYILPGGILVGFLGLFAWAARDSFLPAQSITITPVIVSRAEIKQEGTPLFQAAGWIEPRPTLVDASSLAPGVILNMLVIEGQLVKKGEPVAKLIDTDAKLALAQAKAQHTLQRAEVDRAKAILAAAQVNLAKPVNLQAALADAGALLAKTQLAMGNLPYLLETAKTKQALAEENVRRKELAGDAIPGRILREARAQLATATNSVQELTVRRPTLLLQLKSLRQKWDALDEKLRLLTEETRALAEAMANLAVAKAKTEQTRLAVEVAELRLERMTVRSPITGCVMSLIARPGQRLSGINPHSAQGSSAVVSMYDPNRLQIRVDVRLEDVPQVQIGQPAIIETAALSKPITGEVISVTTLADIQKNTLQVKVAVHNPPEVIKPEMLGKVTFLAPPSPVVADEPGAENPGEQPLRLFVPQSLVVMSEEGATVWVADLTASLARRKSVEVGRGATDEGLVEIIRGLQPTDKLVVAGRESVSEGSRVHVTGEDRTLSGGNWNSQPVARTAQANAPSN